MKQRCRKLRNDRRHTSHYTSDDTGVIKLRRMRWVGHVLRIGVLVIEFQNFSQKVFRYLWEGNTGTDLQDVTM